MIEKILGLYPNLRAKNLSKEMYYIAKNNGIIHCTTKENADSIIKSGVIKCSKNSKKCYSTKGEKCAFFFLNSTDFNLDNIDLNVSKKEDTYIHLENLTEEQMSALRYRTFDNAILSLKDLYLNENSVAHVGKIKEHKRKKFQIKDIVFLLQYISAIVCLPCILAFLIYVVINII